MKIHRAKGGLIPAAQYIRMSTEHQRFSPDNQRAANMAFAAEHGYEIVETYQDSGKSGLTLKKRPELKRLLSDVLGGGTAYKAILVLDVSRWGRFQDADQAAHYEYMCREAGVPVKYCSEAFENDGGAMASLVKHMKRIMAAEYSADLSKKVARAQRQQAQLGYKQGGDAPFATRRQIVDADGKPRMILDRGQRKSLITDRVVLVRGPASEVAVVRRVFQMFAAQGKDLQEISLWLNKKGKLAPSGAPWSSRSVARLLRNEIYVGIYVFGRVSNNLGKRTPNPKEKWVRTAVLQPIVEPALFQAATARMVGVSRRHWSDEEIKSGLRKLLKDQGYISGPTINNCPDLPKQYVVVNRFGSLEKACALIGYEKPLRASAYHVKPYSDEDLLDILRRIHGERGRLSNTVINDDTQSPKAAYFARRLGGFRNAYFLAGITQGRMPQERRELGYARGAMTKKQMIKGLRILLAKHGHLSSRLIDLEPSIPCSGSYWNKFGSLTEAYRLAGYLSSRSAVMKAAFVRKRMGKDSEASGTAG